MRRLAIIDVAGGRQPITNEDGTVVAVFNGEIYNYRELAEDLRRRGHAMRTSSDTEVIVHLYEEEGDQLFSRLRGMFAIAIWDARQRRLLLGRDRLGKKPLYYARTSHGGIVFASELKGLCPLARAAGVAWRLREQGIYDFLSLGVVPQPATIFEEVMALPPGSSLSVDGENWGMRQYWSLKYAPKVRRPYAEVLSEARTLVAEAVRLRLRSDVPLGVFLSGGVDSTVVAYEAARELGSGLRTFTAGFEDSQFNEVPAAASTAAALGVQHSVLPINAVRGEDLSFLVRHYDQPYADSSAIPSLAIARLAREHVKVVLNGDGGDELFAGYRRHLAAHLASRLLRFPQAVRAVAGMGGARVAASLNRRSNLGFAVRLLRGIACDSGARYLVWTSDTMCDADKRSVWRGGPVRATEEWIESQLPTDGSDVDVQLGGDLRINLLSDLLVKMDMATMAASVEARSPLLDYKLAEFTAALPDSQRFRGLRSKALLRDAYAGLVPQGVLDAPKRGFEVPLAKWLAGPLRPMLLDTLGASTARVRDYLDPQFVDGLLRREVLTDRNLEFMVYSLLVLEIWLEQFGTSAQSP